LGKFHPLRKLIFLLLIAQSSQFPAFSQYWQQQVNYTIDVSLNDKDHALDGFEKIEYINNSPDTLQFIWFHLWPNAYKNDKTAFTDQSLENGNTKFYFSNKEDRGYINKLEFRVNDQTASTEDHPQHIDIIKLVLPSPLPPAQKIIITTPFHVKLPFNFSRGGHVGETYQATQWYPKPAVYDKKGWHPIPYLDQGEFYSEFGNFDVRITLPKNYVVAATGDLQNEDEKNWLLTRSAFSWKPQKEKIKTKYGQTQTKTHLYPASSSELKTLKYIQNNVHDFAWFADKRFIVNHDTCKLVSGKIIDAYTFYTPSETGTWKNSLQTVEDAIRTRSEWVGEYPYNVVSAVEGPEGFGGGMEYPTITLISPQANENLLEFTIAHEVGHNWFYGILGTNERQHPWMDEGINTFYDNRYSKWKYGNEGEIQFGSQSFAITDAERLMFESKAAVNKDQPINLEGDKFTNLNYDLVAYYKTGAWLELVEKKLGKETFDKAMQEYYRQWQFKHPYPEDLKKVLETVGGQNLDVEFALLDKKGILPGMESKGTKIIFPYSAKTVVSYLRNPSKNALIFSPVAGANAYDKFMIGAIITNYKLPPSRFQFFAAPLYSTGAKKLNGIGKMEYSFYPSRTFKKINVFLNGSTFSMNSFEKEDGDEVTASFQKLVPGIRFTLNEKNVRGSRNRYIQWKSFLINEESFNISYDSVFTPTDTIINQNVNTVTENRTLHQLKFVAENFRTLYPYKAEFNIEQGKDFIRTAFTGNYFFNYRKEGGLDLRLFAGKFFYLDSKTYTNQFATDRFHLNMTGPNGSEDYTYSDYFIGRNKFDGLPSQQIMMRDGGFKIRTDLYSEKVGKTDDWLAAINLSTTIPPGINPLSLLPVKIPLKVFFDIGTYGEAWDKDASLDHFIFDAGLQLSLFANTVNIYVPIIYSKIYKDYIQSVLEKEGRFWKTISFSIDISNFSLRKVNRELDF
jgi:Peptidase family M1 domain